MENAYPGPWEGVTQRLLTAPAAPYLLQRLPPEPKSSCLASCYQTCTCNCHGEGDPEGEGSQRERVKGAYSSEAHREGLWKPSDPPPSLCASLFSFSFTYHPPSSFLLLNSDFTSIFILHVPLTLFPLFTFNLTGDTMGRVGKSENTWVQVLPSLTPGHVS